MKSARIIITDEGDSISFEVDFNGTFDGNSEAHNAALAIAETVAEQAGAPLIVNRGENKDALQ
jgi:hypothetical protein